MCIIIYKPAGVRMPSDKTLTNCFHNNPDGAGFMYPLTDKGLVRTRKGFMSYSSFANALKTLGDTTDLPLVLHFRITTQGNTDAKNTHPFPITSDHDALIAQSSVSKVALVHNGIIDLTTTYASYKTNNKEEFSDTYYFVRDYMTLIATDEKWHEDANKVALAKKLADSKLAVMGFDGHVELIGSFEHAEDGCLYSNGAYRDSYAAMVSTNYTSALARCEKYDNEYAEFYGFDSGKDFENWLREEDDDPILARYRRISAAYVPDDVWIENEETGSMMDAKGDLFVHDELGRVYHYDDRSDTITLMKGYTTVNDMLDLAIADKDTMSMFEIAR